MPEPVSIQVGGNVQGSIVVGDNNFVVNTNHGTIVYKQAGPQVRAREFVPQPPRPPRDFVNRTAELSKLEAWISARQIVLLYAPDGMGKSSLLKQAANSAAAQAMPNGVILLESVDVDGQTLGPDDVIQHLFDALFESNPPLKVDSVSARTYLSNSRPLVLLDEVSLSPALQKILPDLFPQGAILLTADLLFGSDFERLPIGPLPRQESVNLLATKANLTLNEANRTGLDAICGLLNDVSLAIVITGNVLRETHTPPEAALQAIQDISSSVQNPASAALDRAFSFAFGQLSPEEQKILSAAALTPGVSMSPEWLSSALGGQEIDAFVERLKALGMLFTNSPRLRLPPGLRAAAGRAAVLNEETLLPRLVEFLLAPLQKNPQDWEYIQDELGNFFGALTWAVRSRRWADVIALARALDPYLSLHGLWDAWNTALGYILDAARQSGEQSVQAWALHQSGVREIGAGTRQRALDFLKQALELRRVLGDTVGMAYTQHNIDFLIALPPAGHDGPRPQPPKPPPGGANPLLLVGGLAAAGVLGLVLAAILIGIFLIQSPPVTPYIPIDTDTPTLVPEHIFTPTDTSTATQTPTLIPTLTPTPPGGSGQIVFQSQQYLSTPDDFLYTMTVDGSDPHDVFNESIPARQAAWSPNGKYLAFVSNDKSPIIGISRNHQNQIYYSQIYIVEADGSNIQQITKGSGHKSHPTWSPDGRYIAFTGGDPDLGSDIYFMDARGGDPKNLTNGDGGRYDYPEWSPDGGRIVYQAFVNNENWELFVMNADGSDPKQLTSEKDGWNRQPSWSPDGKRIAFASNRSHFWDIYIMNEDGSGVEPLTRDWFDDLFPDWSPDGHLIVFSSNHFGNLQIYLMTDQGSGIKQLTKMSWDTSEADWRPIMPGNGQ